jgi:hypothetical protein
MTKAQAGKPTLEEVANRLDAANHVLSIIASDTKLVWTRGGWSVEWTRLNGEVIKRRWSSPNGSHYPVWYRHWAHGGICTLALSQLVRWVGNKSVLPLNSWHYWCGDKMQLARHRGAEVCSKLADTGWPIQVPCVLCGRQIESAGDWWSLGGVEGPTCGITRCDHVGHDIGNQIVGLS